MNGKIATREKMLKLKMVQGREPTGLSQGEFLLLEKHHCDLYFEFGFRQATCLEDLIGNDHTHDRRFSPTSGGHVGKVKVNEKLQ
jgi:hypothetical protein